MNERLALLFTDIVSSTEVASRLGDARWRELLERYYARVRHQLQEHEGTEIGTTGDGFFATFYDARAAARCALALEPETADLPLRTRVGLHVGDCDMRGGQPAGINVHLAARVMSAGEGASVIVSESCRDVLSGEMFKFESLGRRSLKGIPGEVHLFRLAPYAGGRALEQMRSPTSLAVGVMEHGGQ